MTTRSDLPSWFTRFLANACYSFEKHGKEPTAVFMTVLMKDGTVAYLQRNVDQQEYKRLLTKALEDSEWFFAQPESPVSHS
jgi:hypothetical protein